MRFSRFILALACLGPARAPARADEPVTVALLDRATVGTAIVTVGDVATVSGGDAATRARIARIDLAELKAREPGTTIGLRTVEYRFMLAEIEARVTGAERTTVTVARRPLTVEEVTAAARAELLRYYANPAAPVAVELAVPIVVSLPEVPRGEGVHITGKPHSPPGTNGRVQMDMNISVGGESLLSFAVHFDVRSQAPEGLTPAGAVGPRVPAVAPAAGTRFATDFLIQPRQRVRMEVNSGPLKVSAVGEAQQAGKLGQTILVQNVDSKKVLSARVTGPGTVEIDIGGAP